MTSLMECMRSPSEWKSIVEAVDGLKARVDHLERQVGEQQDRNSEQILTLGDKLRSDVHQNASVAKNASDSVFSDIAEVKENHFKLNSELAALKVAFEKLEMAQKSAGEGNEGQTAVKIKDAPNVAPEDPGGQDEKPMDALKSVVSMEVLDDSFLDRTFSVRISESAWDACVFIGFDCLSKQDTFIVLSTTLLNAVIQLLFCIIVHVNLTNEPIDEDTVDAAMHWRGVYGHAYEYSDKSSRTSLVNMVCEGFAGLTTSTMQLQLHDDIVAYFPEGEFSAFNGQIMCCLACAVWSLAVMEDIKENFNFVMQVLGHPNGKPTLKKGAKGKTMYIATVSVVQKVLFCGLVALPRGAIGIYLLWMGVKFLAYTYDIGELVLNAMALGFVLDIDEELFKSFAPFRVKSMVDLVQPMCSRTRRFENFDKWAKLFATVIIVVLTWVVYLNPFGEHMRDVKKHLCGGDTDFLTVVNPGSHGLYAHEGTGYSDDVAHGGYVQRMTTVFADVDSDVRRKVWQGSPGAINPPSISSLVTLAEGTPLMGSNQMRCVDHLNQSIVHITYADSTYYHTSLDALRDFFGNTSIESCDDITSEQCAGYANSVLRTLCPEYCGCTNAWVGNMFASTTAGCPGDCAKEYGLSLLGMDGKQIPAAFTAYTEACEDVPLTILNSTNIWKLYVRGVKSMWESLLNATNAESISQQLMSNGCAGLRTLASASVNLCIPNQGGIGRSVRMFCPASCKVILPSICTALDADECPYGCWNFSAPVLNSTAPTLTSSGTITYSCTYPYTNPTKATLQVPTPSPPTPVGQLSPQQTGSLSNSSSGKYTPF